MTCWFSQLEPDHVTISRMRRLIFHLGEGTTRSPWF